MPKTPARLSNERTVSVGTPPCSNSARSCPAFTAISPGAWGFVAMLGHCNPRTNPADIQVNAEQARAWMDKGALPTDTVRSVLKRAGVFGKRPA